MGGAVPLVPQYVFTAWCLVKHRDNFTFTTHLQLVLRLRMRGAILPLPQYVFMASCLVKRWICLHKSGSASIVIHSYGDVNHGFMYAMNVFS